MDDAILRMQEEFEAHNCNEEKIQPGPFRDC